MQSLFLDTRKLDESARERFGLSEAVMMENAAMALERAVVTQLSAFQASAKEAYVVVLCGNGNNGADGYALARRLVGQSLGGACLIHSVVIALSEPKSVLCKEQAMQAQKAGVSFCAEADFSAIDKANVIVDCLFGSGFHGDLDEKTALLCARANAASCIKIACDVPTGLRENGSVAEHAFCADYTVTMGALKCSLYGDMAKDMVGHITCEPLGISRSLFESALPAAAHLLEKKDLRLPLRKKQQVNKGSFGHVAVASGEKIGASCIAGTAALRFGAGLVTLVRLDLPFDKKALPAVSPELMTATDMPLQTTACAFGMGLGRQNEDVQPYFDWLCAHSSVPCVIDADACYSDDIESFLRLRAKGTVLTPHPKELQALLQRCRLGNYTISECVIERPKLIELFCRTFPQAVIVAKGANPLIGYYDGSQFNLYVNPWGTSALAKAGSGDVLAGLIAALLAQGVSPLEAAINGSLAHALASRQIAASYSLTPLILIDAVATLEEVPTA